MTRIAETAGQLLQLEEDSTRPVPRGVEISRHNHNTLLVNRGLESWVGPDTMFTNVRHEGYWNSSHMAFERFPAIARFLYDIKHFSDGTPVALYEGLETLENT